MDPEIVRMINDYLDLVAKQAKRYFEDENKVVQSGHFLSDIEMDEMACQNQRNINAYKIRRILASESAPKAFENSFLEHMSKAGTAVDVYITIIRLVNAYRRAHNQESGSIFS